MFHYIWNHRSKQVEKFWAILRQSQCQVLKDSLQFECNTRSAQEKLKEDQLLPTLPLYKLGQCWNKACPRLKIASDQKHPQIFLNFWQHGLQQIRTASANSPPKSSDFLLKAFENNPSVFNTAVSSSTVKQRVSFLITVCTLTWGEKIVGGKETLIFAFSSSKRPLLAASTPCNTSHESQVRGRVSKMAL